ncbi:MAG: hypothetical protein K2Z80_26320 [Xanthobacteraceae bacterium]|nr:hypothetical protein [Xanthobacteraceae bacterium]
MFGVFPIALALVLAAVVAQPAPAAEQFRNGVRNSESIEVSATRKHHKRSVLSLRSEYAGYRTDIAGNRYFYYRPGGDSPFGPGRGLRPPYPN